MSKPAFGQILDPDFKPTRDAVHVPIIPVIADTNLYPGEYLTLIKETDGSFRAKHWDQKTSRHLAVVDPFLFEGARSGELFYAWLRPESTQKLWHEWTNRELDA